MNESQLKTKLADYLRSALESSVVFRIEDKYTRDIPDMCITFRYLTFFCEVKHVTPRKPLKLKETQSQRQFADRLNQSGAGTFYVIFEEDKDGDRWTYIVDPVYLDEFRKSEHFGGGFAYSLVAEYLKDYSARPRLSASSITLDAGFAQYTEE